MCVCVYVCVHVMYVPSWINVRRLTQSHSTIYLFVCFGGQGFSLNPELTALVRLAGQGPWEQRYSTGNTYRSTGCARTQPALTAVGNLNSDLPACFWSHPPLPLPQWGLLTALFCFGEEGLRKTETLNVPQEIMCSVGCVLRVIIGMDNGATGPAS